MAKAIDQDHEEEDENNDEEDSSLKQNKKKWRGSNKNRRKELSISCMLNTEVGAVLAVIRRFPDPSSQFMSSSSPEETYNSLLLNSLKSLRAVIFNPPQQWHMMDPLIYITPFLDVIQSDDIPAAATAVALSAVLKILKHEIFSEKTPGARDAINTIVMGITSCRLERTDQASEQSVLMRILQLLIGIMRNKTSYMLTDHAVCTLVNTCFQVVQQSAGIGDLLQYNARHTMHELIHIVFERLADIDAIVGPGESRGNDDDDDADYERSMNSGYGARCAIDIFHFLCSMLHVVEVVDIDGSTVTSSDENIQIFALILINSAIELFGEGIGKHPKLLKTIQDNLFYHLVSYGACSSPLVLSMICSTVLNIFQFFRRSIRLQMEAFFVFVLLRVANGGNLILSQEVALEGIVSFCRDTDFLIEMFVNYDCDPLCRNVFEDVGRLLCKKAFPTSNSPLSSIQRQAFEGLLITIHSIADSINEDNGNSDSIESYPIVISEYKPFWIAEKKNDENLQPWIESLRVRRAQKRKIAIAGDHFNRDEKKGLDYLKIASLNPNPPDAKTLAYFYRFTPGLDKNKIGDFLGDPDDFNLQVLKEFTDTFEFFGMILDNALRTYLEAFRLPGESQKIQRILEAFSERFYDQQATEIFVNKDAVFVLCYSLIMLNTDQHNPQVKKKMTEEEFIRNNRAINDGKDLPRENLSELFQSISNNAITIFGQSGSYLEMNNNRWVELINRSKSSEPYIICSFHRSLGRDMFASISGPTVATLCAIFEQACDDETLHECVEGLFSVAKIARFGLEDTLDELIASLCKFTLLLNPYATTEETLYAFSNDTKPRVATLTVFTIANNFGGTLRGGWRNIIDCLLKLKRLKLLPQSIVEPSLISSPSSDLLMKNKSSPTSGIHGGRYMAGLIGRFSQFLSLDNTDDSMAQMGSELEQNLKLIQRCQISNIFISSSMLTEDSLQTLGRALIFASGGRGHKFSTSVEEDETVSFCWELLTTITLSNIHRFSSIWPFFHEDFIVVAQYSTFSSCPFTEKAILCLVRICENILSTFRSEKSDEEYIFKSINLMWKLDKDVLDTCYEGIAPVVSKILTEYPANLQTQFGWKSILHLLSITGRHPETYDQCVETMIMLLSEGIHVTRINYGYCIEYAFGFAALKISPLEKSSKILDLMAETVNLIIQWYQNDLIDPENNVEDGLRTSGLFMKLAEYLRKTTLVRREEIRNHAILTIQRSFILADRLGFTPENCIHYFNHVIFATVDDLHEKLIEYSRRENAEKEVTSMVGTLKLSMEVLKEVFLHYLELLSQCTNFRTFWLGVLRRMNACMKVELRHECELILHGMVPMLLIEIITQMKEKEVLVQSEENDLWDFTCIQIQWMAPALAQQLFPDPF
ncbi:hypothetical protein Sjap_011312 [Stephania japonica]|uniref:SEC7 domain-containing protein n=1 Tax=Stephania japonica TaxID=461633 RepID=A0AAP0P7A9_9MAGN